MAEYIGVEIDENTPEFMSRLRKYFVKRWMDGCQNITYMNSLNSVFIEVDVECSNYINALEFRRYVQKCIPDIPNKDCRRMFMSFDRCSNGYLDFNGFKEGTRSAYLSIQELCDILQFPDVTFTLRTNPKEVIGCLSIAISLLVTLKIGEVGSLPLLIRPRFINFQPETSFGDLKSGAVGQLVAIRGDIAIAIIIVIININIIIIIISSLSSDLHDYYYYHHYHEYY